MPWQLRHGKCFSHVSIISRVRVAFSGLLTSIFGFSGWFYSGLKKDHGKILKIFDRKSILKFDQKYFSSKIENFRNLDFSKIFNWNPTFSKIFDFKKFPKKLDFKWKFSKIENFENFRFSTKNIFDQISKSIFDQKISIFFHEFFFKPL